jgi:Fe-S cluster biogenesis protein NfuA
MDQAARVRAVLERSVLPSVIARGGNLRVLAVDDGLVTLEASGSPGAVLPLIDRIETLVRSALPEITSLRIAGADDPQAVVGIGVDLADRVRQVLDREVNSAIAAHRGHVVLVEVDRGWVRVRLEGGCHGCSLAEVTVRQGIEPLLRARVPEIVGVIDVTDHAAGQDPFFSPAKR